MEITKKLRRSVSSLYENIRADLLKSRIKEEIYNLEREGYNFIDAIRKYLAHSFHYELDKRDMIKEFGVKVYSDQVSIVRLSNFWYDTKIDLVIDYFIGNAIGKGRGEELYRMLKKRPLEASPQQILEKFDFDEVVKKRFDAFLDIYEKYHQKWWPERIEYSTTCHHCGAPISRRSWRSGECEYCGYPVKGLPEEKGKKSLKAIPVILIIIIFSYIIGYLYLFSDHQITGKLTLNFPLNLLVTCLLLILVVYLIYKILK